MTTAKQERAAMSRLIDSFGADVLVNLTPPPSRTPRERGALRAQATGQAEECRACGLCDVQAISDPRGPDFPSLTATCDLAVLVPFPSDGRLHKMLMAAVQQHVAKNAVAYIPIVGCVPRERGGSLRQASKIEVEACQANMHAALDAAGAPNLLIVGEKAMRAWRPDLKLSQVIGHVGTWRSQYITTVIGHPSNANTAGERKQWVRDAAAAVHQLMGEEVGGIGETCIAPGCVRGFHAWDQDALPWCAEHLKPHAHDIVPSYVNERLW
jgi:hypothetical protein